MIPVGKQWRQDSDDDPIAGKAEENAGGQSNWYVWRRSCIITISAMVDVIEFNFTRTFLPFQGSKRKHLEMNSAEGLTSLQTEQSLTLKSWTIDWLNHPTSFIRAGKTLYHLEFAIWFGGLMGHGTPPECTHGDTHTHQLALENLHVLAFAMPCYR